MCWHRSCQVCGAAIDDARLHKRFHDSLMDMARTAFIAAGGSSEDWERSVADGLAIQRDNCVCGHPRAGHADGRRKCLTGGCDCNSVSPYVPEPTAEDIRT